MSRTTANVGVWDMRAADLLSPRSSSVSVLLMCSAAANATPLSVPSSLDCRLMIVSPTLSLSASARATAPSVCSKGSKGSKGGSKYSKGMVCDLVSCWVRWWRAQGARGSGRNGSASVRTNNGLPYTAAMHCHQ